MGIDPVTMTMIGTGVSMASGIMGTIAQMQAAAYQQAVAERNARLAEENAIKAVEQSQQEQADWGQEARAQLGQMMADLSASGVGMGGGTPLLQRRGAESLSRRDAERIRHEGVARGDDFRQQAADFQAEGQMAGRRRTFSLFSGVAGALGTYLGGATQVARTRMTMQNARMIR